MYNVPHQRYVRRNENVVFPSFTIEQIKIEVALVTLFVRHCDCSGCSPPVSSWKYCCVEENERKLVASIKAMAN